MPAINSNALKTTLNFAIDILSMKEGEIKEIKFNDETFKIKREMTKNA